MDLMKSSEELFLCRLLSEGDKKDKDEGLHHFIGAVSISFN